MGKEGRGKGTVWVRVWAGKGRDWVGYGREGAKYRE